MRKIKPTRRSVSGVHAFRGHTPVPYESTVERDLVIRLAFFTDVIEVIAQPVQIPFQMPDGRSFNYTPDYLVYRRPDRRVEDYRRPELIEVKPRSEWITNARKWFPKWKAARRLAIQEGWEFRIHDESRIRDQTFKNIRFLERYRRMTFEELDSQQIIDTVASMGAAPFHYLQAKHFIGDTGVGISHLWHLLAKRQLDCDIAEPLNDFTVFWVTDHDR